MSNPVENDEEDTRRLVVAITDFIRDQLIIRTDLVPEDRDCLEIAIQCLEMAYGLEAQRYVQYRFSRPLLDIFNQVTNPVTVRDKVRADYHKDAGNSYMRRNMFSNAEEEYTHAIELDRWNAIYYCNRASSRIEQRNYFEAISDCRQALMLNPDYAKAHARMGQAYAMIRRPREAARCFRQALELEPTNEKYRNNLRVAESQITRPDAMGIITSLLNSLFGMSPRAPDSTGSSNLNMPTSFMIITESHPATREDAPEGVQTCPSAERLSESQGHPPIDSRNIVFPHPYGIIDEGEEEQAILQIDLPLDEQVNEDFVRDLPGFIIFQDVSANTEVDTRSEAGQPEAAEMFPTEDLAEREMNDVKSVKGGEKREILSPDADNLAAINQKNETEAIQSAPQIGSSPPDTGEEEPTLQIDIPLDEQVNKDFARDLTGFHIFQDVSANTETDTRSKADQPEAAEMFSTEDLAESEMNVKSVNGAERKEILSPDADNLAAINQQNETEGIQFAPQITSDTEVEEQKKKADYEKTSDSPDTDTLSSINQQNGTVSNLQTDIPLDEEQVKEDFITDLPGFIISQDVSANTEADTRSEAGQPEASEMFHAEDLTESKMNDVKFVNGGGRKGILSPDSDNLAAINQQNETEGVQYSPQITSDTDVEEQKTKADYEKPLDSPDVDTLSSINKQNGTVSILPSSPIASGTEVDMHKTKADQKETSDDNIKYTTVEEIGEDFDSNNTSFFSITSSNDEISNDSKKAEESKITKRKPSDETVSTLDSAKMDALENISTSEKYFNSKTESKKDSGMPTAATKDNNARDETESKVPAEESGENDSIADTKNQEKVKTDNDLPSEKVTDQAFDTEENENSSQ